jgi:hypothetical protein
MSHLFCTSGPITYCRFNRLWTLLCMGDLYCLILLSPPQGNFPHTRCFPRVRHKASGLTRIGVATAHSPSPGPQDECYPRPRRTQATAHDFFTMARCIVRSVRGTQYSTHTFFTQGAWLPPALSLSAPGLRLLRRGISIDLFTVLGIMVSLATFPKSYLAGQAAWRLDKLR